MEWTCVPMSPGVTILSSAVFEHAHSRVESGSLKDGLLEDEVRIHLSGEEREESCESLDHLVR